MAKVISNGLILQRLGVCEKNDFWINHVHCFCFVAVWNWSSFLAHSTFFDQTLLMGKLIAQTHGQTHCPMCNPKHHCMQNVTQSFNRKTQHVKEGCPTHGQTHGPMCNPKHNCMQNVTQSFNRQATHAQECCTDIE